MEISKVQIKFLYPLLLAVYPVLYLFNKNFDRLSASDLIWPSCIALTFVAILLFISKIIFKSWDKSALFVTLFYLLLFSFKPLKKIIKQINRSIGHHGNTVEALIVIGLALILVIIAIKLWRKIPAALNAFIGFTTVTLFALQLWVSLTESLNPENQTKLAISPNFPTSKILAPKQKPNIYYLVFDGLGRLDILREMYKVDTKEFEKTLSELGFHIPSNSHSNYMQTLLSLSSTLNMTYLDKISNKVSKKSENRSILGDSLKNNFVMGLLKSLGYSSIFHWTGYSGTKLIKADKTYGEELGIQEFENLILNQTFLPPLLHKMRILKSPYSVHRERILSTLDRIPSSDLEKSPRFVMAHVMAPHPPFIFEKDGSLIDSDKTFGFFDADSFQGSREDYVNGYSKQVTYILNRIEEIATKITETDPTAIIIIQGDHGPGSELIWESLERSNMKERAAAFIALRVSPELQEQISVSITPVNSFRLIFNHYFGTTFERLPDKTYFSKWKSPYDFVDVTQMNKGVSSLSLP